MALNTAGLNLAATGLAGGATYIGLHTADPGTTGANPTTHSRVLASWPAASSGAITVTAKNFTGGAASGAVTYIGLWSAATGGVFYGGQIIPAGSNDQASNAAGAYTLNTVTVQFA